jgi:5-methylthioadenosine/S-adenosylhomocysteine deaminase
VSPSSTLLRGGTVLTCDGEVPDLLSGDVLIRDGRISAVGKDLGAGLDVEVVDVTGSIVFPGLVDAHQHLWEAPYLLQHPNMGLGTYFSEFIPAAANAVTVEGLFETVRSASIQALRSGTTTTFDWCHATNSVEHAQASVDAAIQAGIRYVFGYGPPVALGYYGSDRGHPRAMETFAERFNGFAQEVGIAAALRGPDLAPLEVTRSDITRARAAGLPISMHVSTHRSGPGGVTSLHEAGLLGPDLQFIHLTDATDTELRMIIESGGQVVVPPVAELSMGTGMPPVRRLADLGARFALGVDSVLGSPPDMFAQMRCAAALLRVGEWDGAEPPAGSHLADVLAAATVEGARACWLDSVTGSLTPGKWADLVVLRPSRAVWSLDEAFGQVVWLGEQSKIAMVMVAGLRRFG